HCPAPAPPPSALSTIPTNVAASTMAATPARLAFIAVLPSSSWCGLPPDVAYWSAPHINAQTPAATDTLRMSVASLLNSVLMFPSVDATGALAIPDELTSPRRRRVKGAIDQRLHPVFGARRAATVPVSMTRRTSASPAGYEYAANVPPSCPWVPRARTSRR